MTNNSVFKLQLYSILEKLFEVFRAVSLGMIDQKLIKTKVAAVLKRATAG